MTDPWTTPPRPGSPPTTRVAPSRYREPGSPGLRALGAIAQVVATLVFAVAGYAAGAFAGFWLALAFDDSSPLVAVAAVALPLVVLTLSLVGAWLVVWRPFRRPDGRSGP